MSAGMRQRGLKGCLLAMMAVVMATHLLPLRAQQEEISRKVRSKIQPVYPEIARRLNVSGTVKLQVVVAPNGSVKSTKVMGGHPLLANAAMDAVRKWRFEPGSEASTGVIEFKFEAPLQ